MSHKLRMISGTEIEVSDELFNKLRRATELINELTPEQIQALKELSLGKVKR